MPIFQMDVNTYINPRTFMAVFKLLVFHGLPMAINTLMMSKLHLNCICDMIIKLQPILYQNSLSNNSHYPQFNGNIYLYRLTSMAVLILLINSGLLMASNTLLLLLPLLNCKKIKINTKEMEIHFNSQIF